MALAVELHQLLEHDRAGRHVDAEGERLGGEDGLDAPVGEVPVAEHRQVLVSEALDALLDDPAVALALCLVDEAHPAGQQLAHGGLAASTTEDEGDRRQQPLTLEPLDDLVPTGAAARATAAHEGATAISAARSPPAGVSSTGWA